MVLEVLLAVADVVSWLGALTLVLAGVAKIRRPYAAAQFAHTVGLPSSVSGVRVAALTEVVIAFAILVSTRALALGVLTAVFFAALLAWHWISTGTARVSCGCFGRADSIPVIPHLVGLGAFTLSAAIVGLASRGAFVAVLGDVSTVEALVLVFLLGTTLLLAIGVLGAGRSQPAAWSASRPQFSAGTFELVKESAS